MFVLRTEFILKLITNFFSDYTKCEKKIDLRKNFKCHKSSEIDYIKKIIS